ncbi:all trans-polyprenyl-diphosphate synthase PDSS1-like isoform X1 [Daphnia carinata]|uniref:all trans-polyprenyl-diphosphate synthase PDSS1-like isoform X1 n=1 Tax=Daphnia carinata TaxID=120202 RepID=UPI00257ECBCA|nr:all trans-polyprenyl-diphosphate synthase PDSS1-like isoform X1 [Daphnia carinata]
MVASARITNLLAYTSLTVSRVSYLGNGNLRYHWLLSRNTSLLQLRSKQIQTAVPSITSNVSVPKENIPTADTLVRPDLEGLYEDIREGLNNTQPDLRQIAQYYFNGEGKAVRPVITMCMARAINYHLDQTSPTVIQKQKKIAQIAEMIHTASLVHDDVIDIADSRRSRPSVNILWGQKKSIIAGDFILSVASGMLARLQNQQVIVLLSQVLADLVQGEFMQLGARENTDERFAHYSEKTFKKTASLIAYSCQAVSVLSGADSTLQSIAFQYGRQLGMAFQLVDDLLDFIATSAQVGKPVAADLRLGLATAPVLFAAQKFPELNPLIMRRFQEPGDAETAFRLVLRSDGLQRTKELARQYCNDAVTQVAQLTPSPYQQALVTLAHQILHRMK